MELTVMQNNVSKETEKGAIDIEVVNEKNQNKFLESTLGKTINAAMDVGLRLLLPDILENQVIGIKDTLMQEGLKEGINKAISTAVDFGKSAIGIVTGKFDNVSQVQNAVEKGGIIDGVSKSLDFVLNTTAKSGLLNKGIVQVIKKGKDVILDNVSKNIEGTFTEQLKGIEKMDKYCSNWNTFYQEKNFEAMNREYEKMKEQFKVLLPLESTLKRAREIENLHNLIKNNDYNFDISEHQIALAKKLA